MRISLGMAAIVLATGTAPAMAETLVLAPVYSDHMVLQRGHAVPVEGQAAAGAEVSVQLGDAAAVTTKAGADGAWRVEIPARASGEGLELRVSSGGESVALADVALGDVFLCSGQSNMEFQLRVATNADTAVGTSANPALRLFNVPRQSSPSPQVAFSEPVSWEVSAPESTRDFSAACYFMGQQLQATRKVPVGLIASSWGGSIIQDWLSGPALKSNGGHDAGLELLALRSTNPAAAQAAWAKQAHAYIAPNLAKLEKPMAADVTQIWEAWGAGLDDFDGTGVYSTTVTLTADQAKRAVRIHLGKVDDVDETVVNGKPVGAMTGWDQMRSYDLPKGALKKGVNRIELRAVDTGAGGGMYGTEPRRIELDDGTSVAIDGSWQFQKGPSVSEAGQPPIVPWLGGNGLTTLYNGMIAPLGRIPLAGIAWYQGEANVADADGYKRLLTSLMADWRTRFDTRRFAVVQLANFGPLTNKPVESQWAELRDAQRLVVSADQDAGMAVAIDIGDPYDIHPTNKKSVGQRLAIAMDGASNAQLPSVTRSGNKVTLTYDRDLQVIGDARPVGFEACVATNCRFVTASLTGARSIELATEAADTKIRYLWADSPIANLFGTDGLPVTPFEMALPN